MAVGQGPLVAHWPVGLVLACYIASAWAIPTLANVAVTDDWVYYRTVEQLLADHVLRVHEMASAALVFQTVWGAGFAALLGLSFGVLRVSTVVMVGLSGIAFYSLCRALDVSHGRSALGTAAYLFHPLALSLAYTFMTDSYFTSLLVVSLCLYAWGLRPACPRPGYVLQGSLAAACAILVRQQGVLLPAAVVGALVMGGRLTRSRRGIVVLLQTCAIPAAVTVAFAGWLRYANGVPWALTLFRDDLVQPGLMPVVQLIPRLAVTEALYAGFFVLALAVAVLPALLLTRASLRPGAWWALGAWIILVVGGSATFWQRGALMPYVGQFVTSTGFGPEDLIAARPVLLDAAARAALTVACALAAATIGVALARRLGTPPRDASAGAGIVGGVAVGQILGTFPASVHFINWGGTLDRYLLPLLPVSIALLLWAVRGVRLTVPLAWGAVAVVGAFAVAGTHDHLAFLDGVWSLAREANALGVPNTRLDAGAGWDGFFLYERPPSPDRPSRTPLPPWWIDLFAPATDSSYVVAGAPLVDYAIVQERSYPSWLHGHTLPLYLLRRPHVPGPP